MTLPVDRRTFLASVPAAVLAAHRLMAQGGTQTIKVNGLSQLTLAVSDPARSIDFYQRLFGAPVQARQGNTTFLRIGNGPRFLAIMPVAAGDRPSISRFGMGVEGFNADNIIRILAAHGVTLEAPGMTGAMAPNTVRSLMRGTTREIFVSDPAGINFQLHDPSYCGGAGPMGNMCQAEAAPSKGVFVTRDMSHFTIGAPSARFYQDVFGMGIRAMQGATPGYAVGANTVHFVMFTGGGGGGRGAAAAPAASRIDHACVSIDNFNPEAVTKALNDFGIKNGPRSEGALVTYISLRLENRGGAPVTGTPELYFTDPDGLAIQLQDPKYCGGGGYLGDVCPG